MQQAIAVLDSGVGGLTVVKEIRRQLPQEKIIYFGDTARCPYGPRSKDEVILFTKQVVRYLLRFSPKMIVIACNTATAVALEEIRQMCEIPVIGVIHPGSRAAIKASRTGRIGVIGTEGTIHSGAYEKALKQISPGLSVISRACPDFVPIVEKGLFREPETYEIVKKALAPFREEELDCLILGCTHYPLLSEIIAECLGQNVQLINSAEETAREISTVLFHKELMAAQVDQPVHTFFTSGSPELFRQIATAWLGEEISVQEVNIHQMIAATVK